MDKQDALLMWTYGLLVLCIGLFILLTKGPLWLSFFCSFIGALFYFWGVPEWI